MGFEVLGCSTSSSDRSILFLLEHSMDLEQRVRKIEERNAGVEADKAWETSWVRRLLIALFTYIVASIFLWYIGVPNPLLNALVPTGGFVLSTLTISFFKTLWLTPRK